MTLPLSGPLSLSDIQTEWGGTNPISLSEYRGDGNAPLSGPIELAADFYGTTNVKVNYLVIGGGGGGGGGGFRYTTGGGGGAGGILRRATCSSSRALPTASLLVEVQRAGALNYKPQAAAGVFLAQLRLLVAAAAVALVSRLLQAVDQVVVVATQALLGQAPPGRVITAVMVLAKTSRRTPLAVAAVARAELVRLLA
jgi:hypothetical protein